MTRHVLLLDGTRAAEEAVPHAVSTAKGLGAELHLLQILGADGSPHGAVDSVAWRMRRAEAGAYLEAWRTRIEEQGIPVTIELREGRAEEQLLEVVRAPDVGLLVLCARGEGALSAAACVDPAAHLAAASGVSFFLVRSPVGGGRPADPPRYRRVLVPLDASRRAECALPVALAIARGHGAGVVLAHVAPVPDLPGSMPPAPRDLDLRDLVVARNRETGARYLEEVRSRIDLEGVTVIPRLLAAPDVGRMLCRCAAEEEVDLVVVCAHGAGRQGTGAFPSCGSVVRDLVDGTSVPLWVLQDLPPPSRTETPAAEEAASTARRTAAPVGPA